MARRGGRSRGGRVIDNLRWIGMSGGFAAQAAGTAAVNMLSATPTPDTIMRLRANLTAWVDGNEVPGVAATIGVGLIVVPEGTGTTVLQSPITDPEADWFWYIRFLLGYEEYVTDVVDSPGLTSYREIVDGKAMRRVSPDKEVQLVIENSTFATALDVNVSFDGRILLGQ